MNALYTINDTTKLQIFMWSDFLENENYRKTTDVNIIREGKISCTIKRTVLKDKKGIYILWNKLKVYLNDFDYLTVPDLIKKLKTGIELKDRWFVSDDEIIATLMKDTDNFGIVMDMAAYDTVIPEFGIGLISDNKYSTLCVPTEKRFLKNQWHYKFTVECEGIELRKYIPSRDFYTSDFCSLLKSGHITLVDKNSFVENISNKYREQDAVKKKVSYKLAKFFGRVKEEDEEKFPLVTIK